MLQLQTDCCDLQTAASGTTAYHLQRALPGGIVLMELAFQVRSAVLTNTLYDSFSSLRQANSLV